MVVWCPDWPVVAAQIEENLPAHLPVAVVAAGAVRACSPAARTQGVRRGMRRRDAAAHCPELVLVDAAEERDVRCFEAVLGAVESVASSVSPMRPGLCALGVASRYYGGEAQAAAALAERLVAAGVWDCRIGVADGMFAAEQAARRAPAQECVVISPGRSAGFLAALPVAVLPDAELVSLLRRLGLRSLGDFAGLASRDVLTRFGAGGHWWHRLARGQDERAAVSRRRPLDLEAQIAFEPPLETIEPIAFSSRQTAEQMVSQLAARGLVCTQVRIEVTGDRGWTGSRTWAHSRWFAAADLVDRLYWQLQGDPAPEPVTGVRFVPDRVEPLGDHGEGLWGSAPDERVERGVARLQGMLGPEAVLAPAVQGGRSPRDRQLLTPWGDRAASSRPVGLPWPGSLPPPAPVRVFAEPKPALVAALDGQPVGVSERGLVSAAPVRFQPEPEGPVMPVEAWAGPWPIDELWWDETAARRVARFQLVGADGSAWLLVVEGNRWWTEARYD
jgi:protein ImuB